MNKKAKILCTLGPSSDEPEQIRNLLNCGMDAARINFSHGTLECKKVLFDRIRENAPSIAILCDIQGPKIRVGRIKDPKVFIKRDSEVVITTEQIEGDEHRFSISYDKLPEEVKVGDHIYINDGIICLQVQAINGTEITCRSLIGGFISSKKGVNLPFTKISLRVPTKKDVEDLKIIADLDPEYVALSFVGSAEDVRVIRDLLRQQGNERIKLIAKIERPVAVDNFDEILEAADGIMVARGDLGVEINAEEVPHLQKEMIRKCNIAAKPVIVATQMLESMIKNPTPTRAEISDVYNAVLDGADAVMLSAETASGDYPAEAVKVMQKVIINGAGHFPDRDPDKFDSIATCFSEVIAHQVYSVCKDIRNSHPDQGKIICLTRSGYTARLVSKYRPSLPVIALTEDPRTARELSLQWGTVAVYTPAIPEINTPRLRVTQTISACTEQGVLGTDDVCIVVGNFLTNIPKTNMLSILSVKDVLAAL